MSIKTAIAEALTKAGHGDRLWRIFGACDHFCGLPNDEGVLVAPTHSPVDGAHALRVTATEVASYVCPYPSNFRDWYPISRQSYTTPEEMVRIVTERIEQPRGCW
jgi:hypothetical protein